MDAFYASWSSATCVARGKPLRWASASRRVVPRQLRGAQFACARHAMARRCACPELLIVRPDFARYGRSNV